MTSRLPLALALLPVLLAVGCDNTAPSVLNLELVGDTQRVAVLPFSEGPGARGSAETVTGYITSELLSLGRFQLIERSELKALLDERDLQAADLVDSSQAAELGKILAVDAVVIGTVTEYDEDRESYNVYVTRVPVTTYKVGATLRMIDVATGEIIYAHSASGVSRSNITEAGNDAAQKLLAPLQTGP